MNIFGLGWSLHPNVCRAGSHRVSFSSRGEFFFVFVAGDGLPSIVGVDEETMSESEGSCDQTAVEPKRKRSGESKHPDLEDVVDGGGEVRRSPSWDEMKRARELYDELRQMSAETGVGRSIEDLMSSIGASTESLASIIPLDKRQELSRFEMSLKEMIEEARQLAEADGSVPLRRSMSVVSNADSVVSVIERPPQPEIVRPEPRQHPPPPSPPASAAVPLISVNAHEAAPAAPSPMARRRKAPPVPHPQAVVGADRYEEIINTRRGSASRGPSVDRQTSGSAAAAATFGAAKALPSEVPHSRPTGSRSYEPDHLPHSGGAEASSSVELPSPAAGRRPLVATPKGERRVAAASTGARPWFAPRQPPAAEPFVPKQIEVRVEPEPKLDHGSWWRIFPDWLLLSTTYSFVLVAVLLIGNSTPDGRLYIYFTAFWSLVLYFFSDDPVANFQSNDLIDSVAESLAAKRATSK